MDFADGKRYIVDPDVRAHVSSIVSALGGNAADENGQYMLGDDALACLRDLKRWLKLYDEKLNRFDVARCLAESNFVGGDILQILAAWPENTTEDKLKFKTALSCLELLVPLTWPIEKDPQQMTENHHRHVPYLQIAQVGYKRSIINFDGARILHTAVRCALPSIAESMKNRTARDEGIIKLLLYFIRNISMIAPPPNLQWNGDDSEVSRSALIDAFGYQDIFHLLLTVSSTMGEEFSTQDVIILDIIFHIVKGVDPEELFWNEKKTADNKINELVRLRKKEATMLSSYQKNAPTRHNRFGSMIWMQRDDAKMTTVTSSAAIVDCEKSLAKMDSTKRFKPPRRPHKGENGPLEFYSPVSLSINAKKHLRLFVEDFLDSSFNPLFSHIRKAIDREAERVMDYHPRQFFYVVNWFLLAERLRRDLKGKEKITQSNTTEDLGSFPLVAGVLNQEMFITLVKAMNSKFENKLWSDLSAAMKCFSQILLTVQEMLLSPLEEDQEIAGNILSRFFYEETIHDLITGIARTYKDQGFGYLDAVTEITHIYLRVLENYSKINTDLQVRSRRKLNRKNRARKTDDINGSALDEDGGEDHDSSESDEARARYISRERRLDFKRFSLRFVTQGCVNTFVAFTIHYNELKPDQLKRAHRFLYRVAFKNEMSVMLFRVDIIALLYKMIKGPQGLDKNSPGFKEWEELVRQILKKCLRKTQERPELFVEMLFSKNNTIAHFLEYGYQKQTFTVKPRVAAELEVKGNKEWDEQICIVVSAILNRSEEDHLRWLKSQLMNAEIERRRWEDNSKLIPSTERDLEAQETPSLKSESERVMAPAILIQPDTSTRQVALLKNGFLRLLVKLIGLHQDNNIENSEVSLAVPPSLSADDVQKALNLINYTEFNPPVFESGQEAADFIKPKSSDNFSRKKSAFDDESNTSDDGHHQFFEPGGPTSAKKLDLLETIKKKKSLRKEEQESFDEHPISDAQLEARKAARMKREFDKNRRIKSELFVHDSDEESDEERDREFFEREEKLRQRNKISIMKELLNTEEVKESMNKSTLKRSSGVISDGLDEQEEEDFLFSAGRKRRHKMNVIDSDTE
ncbi:Topoisomerase 1-associated factor 1 [Golovinomyces cichoracearum]|uniref:Topoisomerase 1-associated factor 1 n=1 Tax=Golovinomyces cichoracearum TaxID=62708 RepID=A0A420H8E9_9PEZI|nr:Topoisomerase 1-associated factor 1 [Golovinomyces cichoracearum]